MRGLVVRRFLQLVFVLATSTLPLSGCVAEFAAEKLVAAPNRGLFAQDLPISQFIDGGFRVDVGPPAASMMVWVVEPKRAAVYNTYDLSQLPPAPPGTWSLMRTGPTREGISKGVYQVIRYRTPGTPEAVAYQLDAIGTIIILQGYSCHVRRNAYLWPWAAVFADAGYRVLMPDLRGHGDSTGGQFTWGVQETRDLSQLIDELERRGMLEGKLGIFGHSTGASIAIATAAADPRVDAVIAVSPWYSMREAIGGFRDWKLPWLGWLLNERVLDNVARRAGRRGGFDPDEANAARWIAQTDTPVLLLHGGRDPLLSAAQSRAIYRARTKNTELIIYPNDDHWSHMELNWDDMRARCLEWTDRYLAPDKERPAPTVASAR
jgi:alpha-beta hydrolase superfamily lysophospholipase